MRWTTDSTGNWAASTSGSSTTSKRSSPLPSSAVTVLAAPPRLVAYMLTALIGHMAHRGLSTDDGVSAAEAAGLVVSLVMKGLRPSER